MILLCLFQKRIPQKYRSFFLVPISVMLMAWFEFCYPCISRSFSFYLSRWHFLISCNEVHDILHGRILISISSIEFIVTIFTKNILECLKFYLIWKQLGFEIINFKLKWLYFLFVCFGNENIWKMILMWNERVQF